MEHVRKQVYKDMMDLKSFKESIYLQTGAVCTCSYCLHCALYNI